MESFTLKGLILTITSLIALNTHAGIGTLASVKMCTDRSGKQQCSAQSIPKNRVCSVTTTSLSNGLIGDSDFRGVYSIPAANKEDKVFKSSVVIYGDSYHGIVRGPLGGSQIGEWTGDLQKSVKNKYKVTIKNFYLYEKSGKAGFYLQYHCKI